MKKQRIVILSSATLIFTVLLIIAWWIYSPIYAIKSTVKNNLADPDSAQFSDIKFYRETGYACGFVNVKNKMGGYVGKKLFIASIEGELAFEPTMRALESSTSESPNINFNPNLSMEQQLAASLRGIDEARKKMEIAQDNIKLYKDGLRFYEFVKEKCARKT